MEGRINEGLNFKLWNGFQNIYNILQSEARVPSKQISILGNSFALIYGTFYTDETCFVRRVRFSFVKIVIHCLCRYATSLESHPSIIIHPYIHPQETHRTTNLFLHLWNANIFTSSYYAVAISCWLLITYEWLKATTVKWKECCAKRQKKEQEYSVYKSLRIFFSTTGFLAIGFPGRLVHFVHLKHNKLLSKSSSL